MFVLCGTTPCVITPSDQDGDEDDYNTMVVKDDDNESVVSNFVR